MTISKNLVDFTLALTLNQNRESKFKSLNVSDFKHLEKVLFFNKLETRFIDFINEFNLTHQIEKKLYKKINHDSNFRNIHNISLLNNTKSLLKIYNEQEVSYCLLKGAYPNADSALSAGYRPIRDIDILVSEKDIEKALKIALESGYKFKDNALNNAELAFKKDYRKDLPNLVNSSNQILELHYRFSDPFDYEECIFNKLAFKNKITKNIFGVSAHFPEPIVQVLMAVYSGTIKGFFDSGSLFLSDIKYLMEKHNISDKEIIEHAKKINLDNHAKIIINVISSFDSDKSLNDPVFDKIKKLIVYNSVGTSKRISEIFLEKKFTKKIKKIYRHSISDRSQSSSKPFKSKLKRLLSIPNKLYDQCNKVGSLFLKALFLKETKKELEDLSIILKKFNE